MGMRVLVVDDESLARLRLCSLLAECTAPPAQVVGEAAHADEAMAWLATGRCDVVLLDIHMPGLDGMSFAQHLRDQPDAPAVVFVTAHAEHALQAFELDAVDYLTKPVRRDRLQAALQRAMQRVVQRGPAAAPAAIETEPMLVVNELGRRMRVPVSDVLYLKAELKYVTLRTATHTHVLDDSLTDLEQRLGPRFLRVHRNALVARRAMQALERRLVPGEGTDDVAEGWAVRVAPVGEWLAVSRRQVSAVKEAIAEGAV